MKNLILFIVILFLFSGCLLRDNPIIKIENRSSKNIDSIEVFAFPTNKTVFKDIKPKEKRKGVISFEGIPKQDGGIGLILYDGSLKKEVGLAYYTNGGSLSYGFKAIIENDTILIKDLQTKLPF